MIICLIFPFICAKFPPDGTTISFLQTKSGITPPHDDKTNEYIYHSTGYTTEPYSAPFRKTKPIIGMDWMTSFPSVPPVQPTQPFELELYVEVFRIGSITNVRFLADDGNFETSVQPFIKSREIR